MKNLSIAFCVLLAVISSCSKTDNGEKNNEPIAVKGSVVARQAEKFKLYKTQNMWTFLKLNTSTGQIWQVQYSTKGDEYRFETPLSLDILNSSGVNGRFELYPTENIYNFILLDTFDGGSYQIQWSGDAENRFLIPIK